MIRAAIILNGLALCGYAWLVWLHFFRARPAVEFATHQNVYSVDASLHSGLVFLVPTLLLAIGLGLQFAAFRGTS